MIKKKADMLGNVWLQDRDNRLEAARYLLNYQQLLKEYQTSRKENLTPKLYTIGRHSGGHIPDPTAWKAIKNADYDLTQEPYRWLKSTEIVENSLGLVDRCILEYRRKINTPELRQKYWVSQVQAEMCYGLPGQWFKQSYLLHRWKKMIDNLLATKRKMR